MIKSYEDLLKMCPNINSNIKKVIDKYGIHITDYYLSLFDINNPDDPLYKVVMPVKNELCDKEDELLDPIGDDSKIFDTLKTSMLVHRYSDRVLFLTTDRCMARCRYCFRKSRLFCDKNNFDEEEFNKSLEYIKNHKEISEVILSGGDPLCMERKYFYKIFDYIISNCPHVKGVRIHTRAPVYNPYILTDDLVNFLNNVNEKLVVVFMLHIVHAREVTDVLRTYLNKLKLLKFNQTPILKGVNATVTDLIDLSWSLVRAGIVPHYLHYLDKAKGTSHFRISIDEARNLVLQLQGHLSGHLIPKLILDVPDGMGKIWLNQSFILDEIYDDEKHTLKIKSTHSDKTYNYVEKLSDNINID